MVEGGDWRLEAGGWGMETGDWGLNLEPRTPNPAVPETSGKANAPLLY